MRKESISYVYNGNRVEADAWFTPGKAKAKTIVLLGTVQVGMLAEWVAEKCPPNTVIIEGAPHWLAQDDGSDMTEFMFQFTKRTFDFIHEQELYITHVITDSQATPAAIKLLLLKKYRAQLQTVVMLQPVGLNASSYGQTHKERLRTLHKRVAANARYQLTALITDPKLRHNHRLLSRAVGRAGDKTWQQYSAGLAYDSSPDIKELALLNRHALIICGEHDRLFPASEITATLAEIKVDIPVRTVAGVPHSPLATKQGNKLLQQALGYSAKESKDE